VGWLNMAGVSRSSIGIAAAKETKRVLAPPSRRHMIRCDMSGLACTCNDYNATFNRCTCIRVILLTKP